MPLNLDALLNQIDANLGAAVSSSTQNSRAVDNLYEAFLYGLVLRAARGIDARAVAWQNLTGPNGDEVRLRGGPGEVFSPNFSFDADIRRQPCLRASSGRQDPRYQRCRA